jgi:hypothetical protein
MNIEMNNDKMVMFLPKSSLNEPHTSTILTAVIQYAGKQLESISNTGGIENIICTFKFKRLKC